MNFDVTDFNGSKEYFEKSGADCWGETEAVVSAMPLFLQASQQAGITGNAIFDPKASNDYLNRRMQECGWRAIRVPESLNMFGKDWDGGKASVLAEWQFSNYPFLWNNVIRTEAVFKSTLSLNGVGIPKALIIVTKSGLFPSSNSTLYYEQAKAQLDAVTTFKAFEVPIRLVGLTIPANVHEIEAMWSDYPSRYSRTAGTQDVKRFAVAWHGRNRYGQAFARITALA